MNHRLLDRINSTNSWHHYKKTKPIWAKRLDEQETVDTLEGKITYQAGDYLCKGPMGDIWGQKENSLFKKYNPTVDSKLDKEGWLEFIPKPEASGVMAAQVDFDFSIEHPIWGTMIGMAGDYLVKSFEDKDTKYPDDIWIVRKEIFKATYESIIQDENLYLK